jgi:hypothetical protein
VNVEALVHWGLPRQKQTKNMTFCLVSSETLHADPISSQWFSIVGHNAARLVVKRQVAAI